MLSMGLLSRLTKQTKTEMKPSEEAIQVVAFAAMYRSVCWLTVTCPKLNHIA